MDEKTEKLAAIKDDLLTVEGKTGAIAVTNDEEKAVAVEFLSGIKERMKKIEALRKQFVQPFNDGVKRINNEFRVPLDKLKTIFEIGDKKVKAYVREQERLSKIEYEKKKKEETEKLRKIEEENRKKREAELAKAKNEEDKKRIEAEAKEREEKAKKEVAPAEVAQPSTQTRTEEGLMSTKKNWQFEIVNEKLLPAKYWIIDEKAIRKDVIQGGEREISGIRIYQELNTSYR